MNGLVTGYRIYRRDLPRGSHPPDEFFRRGDWVATGAGVLAFGSITQLDRTCDVDSDVYFSYTLVLDSGFETPYVSAPSTRSECGPNIADPAAGPRERPTGRRRVLRSDGRR
jgi:hypothetical protein